MDNTEKVEQAINQYLESEDASFLDKIKGITGTEPFGDSDLGYCVAKGSLSDIIDRIKKITNFSELLPNEQLELDNKTIIDKNSEVEDSENLVTEEIQDLEKISSFSEEGCIGNQITDGDTVKEQLELDNKVLIDKNADVDDDEDFVVAEFSDLKFSDSDSDSLPTIDTNNDTLSQVTKLLDIAKEIKELESNSKGDEVIDSENTDIEESPIEDDYSYNEDFSINDETINKHLHNFSLDTKTAMMLSGALVSGDRVRFRNLCKQAHLDTIQIAKIENFLHKQFDFSEKNFDNSSTKSAFEIDLENTNKRIEEGKSSKKGETIQKLLDNAKDNDGVLGLGGSEEAKKDKPIYEAQKKALASGKDEKYLQDKKEILEEAVKDEQDSKDENSATQAELIQTINNSVCASFRNNLNKELHNK